MASEEGQAVYRRRLSVEVVNGMVKRRGLGRRSVRGLVNMRVVILLHALAHKVWRGQRTTAAPDR